MDKKRERGDNWTQEEKDLFLQIMSESADIIENKKTDSNTNKRKNLEWINVQQKFCELGSKKREVDQLKGAWRRLRMSAKNRIAQHKRALSATGGGQKPQKAEISQKGSIMQSHYEVKKRRMRLLEDEYELKMKYQKQELLHQEQRHKLEIEILMIEKEKKAVELELVKSQMTQ